jgi:hypothetical protein
MLTLKYKDIWVRFFYNSGINVAFPIRQFYPKQLTIIRNINNHGIVIWKKCDNDIDKELVSFVDKKALQIAKNRALL